MNFLKYVGVSAIAMAGMYITVSFVFRGVDILDWVAMAMLIILYKILPLLLGAAFTLFFILMFIKHFDSITSQEKDNLNIKQVSDAKAHGNEASLQNYRSFFNSAYQYAGSYPIWKVQQEFRALVLAMKSDKLGYEYHFQNIDDYLSKLIAEVAKRPELHPWHNDAWETKESLAEAKGDDLLELIQQKQL